MENGSDQSRCKRSGVHQDMKLKGCVDVWLIYSKCYQLALFMVM